jgi:hypothetical protein
MFGQRNISQVSNKGHTEKGDEDDMGQRMEVWKVIIKHKDVIQVNDKVLLVDKVGEDSVHKGPKSGRGIAEAKGHDEGLKKSEGALKDGFPFITFFNVNVVVSPSDIEFGKVTGTLEFINEIGNQGQRCGVFNGNIIEVMIILNRAELAIFLSDEEKGTGNWRL